MFKKQYLRTIAIAMYHFVNQPLFAYETVLNPVRFWQIYQNRQMLENCWNYNLIKWFEACWQVNEQSSSDSNLPLESDSPSIGV